MAEEKEHNTQEESESRVYELGYHILPSVTEENLSDEVAALKALVTKHNGTPVSEEAPKMLDLAYTMRVREGGKFKNYNSAYFGWMKFEMDPEQVVVLEESVRAMPTVLRSIVFKTVKENTRAGIRAPQLSERPTPTRERQPIRREEENTGPVSEEELDKSIEELVVE
ncbi:hypothetical protein COU17_03090 [Candidatus Kaiserbacteria bacterium CG10_big_fil_rev_8_21_14_0_10_49_17]|uniref:Small ribosomal subunit protein bS6 n=1 Tax=Candidatus Kaiserbacteria bacterium CG10_big_fil_rev_8_21_14_0_10_49_17 TaxID=1974609 RepID=A0A2M6WDP2_9BACT|nr:MAG: hypothetical protein COU17_03090 [Candidatus Kaiserbacteria bacterium CG10_big_fil_rev_8_21_14_0_10_49_17]